MLGKKLVAVCFDSRTKCWGISYVDRFPAERHDDPSVILLRCGDLNSPWGIAQSSGELTG